MDYLLMICNKVWQMFTTIGFPVEFQGNTYYITLVGIFFFTSITTIAVYVLFSLFE